MWFGVVFDRIVLREGRPGLSKNPMRFFKN